MKPHQNYPTAHRYQEISTATRRSQRQQYQHWDRRSSNSSSSNVNNHSNVSSRHAHHEQTEIQKLSAITTSKQPLSPNRSSAFSSPITTSPAALSTAIHDKLVILDDSSIAFLSPANTTNNGLFTPDTPRARSISMDNTGVYDDAVPPSEQVKRNLDYSSVNSSPYSPRYRNESIREQPITANSHLSNLAPTQNIDNRRSSFHQHPGPSRQEQQRGQHVSGTKSSDNGSINRPTQQNHHSYPSGVTTRSGAATNAVMNRTQNTRLQATKGADSATTNEKVIANMIVTSTPIAFEQQLQQQPQSQRLLRLQNEQQQRLQMQHRTQLSAPSQPKKREMQHMEPLPDPPGSLPDPPGSLRVSVKNLDNNTSEKSKLPDPPSERKTHSSARIQLKSNKRNPDCKLSHSSMTKQSPQRAKAMVRAPLNPSEIKFPDNSLPVPMRQKGTPKASNRMSRAGEQVISQEVRQKLHPKPDLGINLPLDHHTMPDTGSLVSSDSFGPHRNDWNPDDNDIDDEACRSLPENRSTSFGSQGSNRNLLRHQPPLTGQQLITRKYNNTNNGNEESGTGFSDMQNRGEWKSAHASSSLEKAIDTLKFMVSSQYMNKIRTSNLLLSNKDDRNTYDGGAHNSEATPATSNSTKMKHYLEREIEEAPAAVDTSTESVSSGGLTGPYEPCSRSDELISSGPKLDLKELVDEIRSHNQNKDTCNRQDLRVSSINEHTHQEEKKDDEQSEIQRHLSISDSVDSMGQTKPAPLAIGVPTRSDIHKPVPAIPSVVASLGLLPNVMSPIMKNSRVGRLSQEASNNLTAEKQPQSPIPDVSKKSGASSVTPMMRMRNPEVIVALEDNFINNSHSSTESSANESGNESDSKAELDYHVSKQRKWKEKMKLIEQQREKEKRALTGNDDGGSTLRESSSFASRSMKVHCRNGRSPRRKRTARQKKRSGKGREAESVCIAPALAITGMLDRVLIRNCGVSLHNVISFGDDDDNNEDNNTDIMDDRVKSADEDDESTASLETENDSCGEGSRTIDTSKQLSIDGESEAYSRSTKTSHFGTVASTMVSANQSEGESSRSSRASVVRLKERSSPKHESLIGIRDKNFIRAFITDVTRNGVPLLLHKKDKLQSLSQPTRVAAFVKMGRQAMKDGDFSEPCLVWNAPDGGDEDGSANLFEIRSLAKATAMELENYPLAMPGRSLFLRMKDGMDYVFETSHENTALRFIHGMRWVIARFSFNLIIGNVSVSCELLEVDRGSSSSDDPDDGGKFPKTLKEEAQWTRAMNDATNQLIETSMAQLRAINDDNGFLV